MKVNISSVHNLFFVLNSLKNKDNIEITGIDSSVIPHLDFFIDRCHKLGCNVQIKRKLLANLNILKHFSDRVQIH